MMDEKIDALDRISDLPEFIMHHILSFLPRKEAVKASLLSKKWNCIWSSFPILDFDQCCYVKNNGWLYLDTRPRNKKRVKRFMNIVDKSFGRFHEHKFQLQRFKLHMTLVDFKLASLVDKWIEWAFAHDAKEIDLVVMTKEKTYALPRATFVEQSTNGCKLERAFSRSAVKFYSLKKLSLRDICLNEETIQDIIHTCPFITDVDIIVCKGLKTVEISKLPKLRYFNLISHNRDVECVQIEAPNLQYFRFSGSEQCLLDITACKDLKELSLDDLNITDQLFHFNVSRLPLLEDLVVSDCDMLRRIKISAQKLRDLRIFGCQKLLDVEIDAPSLSFFQYFNDGDKMAKIFSKNAPCPLEFNLTLDFDHVDTQWLLKLRELLLMSDQRKTLRIVVICREVTFNLEELRGMSFPPPYEMELLKLDVRNPALLIDYTTLIDGLLWSCRPKILSVPIGLESQDKCIKVLCEKVLNREDPDCCCSSHHKCWRHYLKGAKLTSIAGIEDEGLLNCKTLLDMLPTLASDQEIQLRLDWEHHLHEEVA